MSDSKTRCILRRTNEPVRPQQGLHIGTWVAGARLRSPDLAFPTADRVALHGSRLADHRAPEEHRDLR